MTQPLSHGYPDYGRFRALSDVVLESFIEDTLTTTTEYGPHFTGALPFLVLKGAPDGARAKYTLLWYNNSDLDLLIAADSMILPAASASRNVFPVMGPWLVIQVSMSAYPNVHGMSASMVSSGAALTGDSTTDLTIFDRPIANVAAGTTETLTATKVFGGEVSVFAYGAPATSTIRMDKTDLAGARTQFMYFSDKAAGEPTITRWTGFIPPVPLVVELTNGSAAPGFYSFHMQARPGWGGK